MADIVRPKIQRLAGNEDATYGKFLIEPLERGFGTTLGNSLRRILLAFIEGLAPAYIKIEGILHEFTTIPGVYEDVMEMILNLKELTFRSALGRLGGGRLSGESWIGRIEASGEGEVTAADIRLPADIEVVHPERHIATLTSPDASLYMEIEIQRGRGYVPAEQQPKRTEIGLIPVDSIFSPIRKANYFVEPTRLGHRTDFDRLVMEVWTDGGMEAAAAIGEAARVLDRYLRYFFEFADHEDEERAQEEEAERSKNKALEYRIEDLDFSVRTYNCLKKEQINTIAELVQRSEQDLMTIRNFGKKSLTEVCQKLAQLGLALRESLTAGEEDEDLSLDSEDFDLPLPDEG